MKYRMLTPPSCFWNVISNEEWQNATDEEQGAIIEQAKVFMIKNPNYNPLATPDQKVIIDYRFI